MNKIYSLLGLAVRSRNAVSGSFATEKAVKSGRAAMVIVSKDASDNTVKMFRNMCSFYGAPIFRYGKRKSWVMPWEKKNGRYWLLRMKGLQDP